MAGEKRLRIALFSWESLHSIRCGGLAPAVSELADAIAAKGHEVHLFTRMGEGQGDYEKVNGVHYHRCIFPHGNGIMEYTDNMCRAMVDRFYATEEIVGRFDVVHGHDWHIVNALDELKRRGGYPVVLTYHSTEWGRNGSKVGDWWEYWAVSNKEWYGGYIGDRVVTLSQTMKDEVMSLYGTPSEKIEVLSNAVEIGRYHKKLDAGRVKERYGIHPLAPTILYIGRLTYQKGPDLLVSAIPRVLGKRWDARFVFVGDGGMRGHLEYLAKEASTSHAVHFLGYVPDEEYVELLNACDIVCIPSRNEPFGIVLLEAWSAGRAVVATNVGGLDENIVNFENGIKVYLSPESIAWGINYIIDDAEGVALLGKRGRRLVEEKFTWDKVAGRKIKLYRKLIKEKGR